MRNVRKAACAALGICVLFGCSTFRDQSKAMVGGGAVAGQDYINGLMPSAKARAYFAENSSDEMTKSVAISRTGDDANDTGVRFVANGGVVIPPGVSITFENQGYCCDPHLPAPMAGDEYQFVKTSQLIPDELQPIYRKLLTKASNGDEATLRNMQKLVWALRTAGTEAGYANNLTEQERRILNSCSEYEGEFESYCSEKLSESRLWKFLWAKIDSVATINIGGVTYQASDLLDENVGEKKIKEHLGQLITLGESMPIEHNGFNYGEISDGIYTDIKGTGALRFKATVANSTSREFTFYPMDYVAQVGSGVSDESASVVYYATALSTQKQRVTMAVVDTVTVIGRPTKIEDAKQIEVESSSIQSLRPAESKFVVSEDRAVDDLEAAINKFEKELRKIDNHKSAENVEYYFYYVQYRGKKYVTEMAGGVLKEDVSRGSAIMNIGMSDEPYDFGRNPGDEVLAVIHSHPEGKNSEYFSEGDRIGMKNSSSRTWNDEFGKVEYEKKFHGDYVLVDTGHEEGWFWKKYKRSIMRQGSTYDRVSLGMKDGNPIYGYVGEEL